ncbi:hypothetical protein [Parasediminibacterium sp. JCM 36343]|uniref:hypothetical protein n=1 Tax=Parasediminibacterium sp. JCM 36343 TaxID=3374279 RepID=UPI003977FCFF
MKNIWRIIILMAVAIGFAIVVANAQSSWPKEIPLDNGGKIIIYQPQPESLNGDILAARAAVSIAKTSSDDPTFGALWFDATLQTDKDSRTATLESLNIKQAKFPGIQDQQQLLQYTQKVQSEVPKWNMQFSLDQLLTSIEQTKQLTDPNLKNDAPNIIYKNTPTTLVIIDGEPKLQLDKQSNLQKVVNTPSTIVLSPDDNMYYLYGGGLWYKSKNILNGWSNATSLPVKIQQLDLQIQQQQKKNNDSNATDKPVTPTDILISTVPAELIQTEGSPTYQTVEGTNLLYVNNSLNDIFKDINTQQNYILISGRWYTSTSLSGGWQYVPADKLPADFAKIPEGTEKDGVLSSVAGTSAANEALMDAQIPQTAKIDRATATTIVTYDGSPVFNPIQGTNLNVAENSSITVLKSNGNYYAVDNGVWYVSNRPNGPWQVSTDRPADVNNIPPDNMAYNVKYVYVYDYTPDYVYAGYTPGYLGCYSYGPTVVWGTGYYYRPWYRHTYYPRAYTWGFGMAYNPWTGWNIGYTSGYSLGWHYYDRNPYCSGWFGPRAYRPPYRQWGYNGGFYGRREVVLAQPNIRVNRPINIVANTPRPRREIYINNDHKINLYNRVQGARTVDVNHRATPGIYNAPNTKPVTPRLTLNRPQVWQVQGVNKNAPQTPNSRPFARPSSQMNNVAADQQGNIYKKDNEGWKQRDNSNWKPATPTPDMNRVQQQRERGGNREQYYQRSQPVTNNIPYTRPAPVPRMQQVPPQQPQRSSCNGGGRRRD